MHLPKTLSKFQLLMLCTLLSTTALAKFKDIVPQHDAHIASKLPGTVLSGGTNTSVFLQKGGTASTAPVDYGDEHAWLQFDLTGQIPPGAALNRATVRFYVFSDENFNSDLPLRAIGVPDAWDETNLTWNSAAALTPEDLTPAAGNLASTVTIAKGQRFRWYEMDVTDYVQDQLNTDPTNKVSVAIEVDPGFSALTDDVSFRANSKDYLPEDFVNGTFAPRLRLEYTGNWPTGANDIKIIHTNDIH